MVVFSANPLALSVSEPAFESWLRDNGYLEIVDHRTSQLHHHNPNPAFASVVSDGSFVPPVFAFVWNLMFLFTINPFAKLTTEDLSRETPSWTADFIGTGDSYSLLCSSLQANLRVHENVKRYMRNYATLFILFFVCSLYQMPLALVGIVSCLVLWDAFRLCSDLWGLHQYPSIWKLLLLIVQCVSVVILCFANVQKALFLALGVAYIAMILHAAFRKLTPMKKSTSNSS